MAAGGSHEWMGWRHTVINKSGNPEKSGESAGAPRLHEMRWAIRGRNPHHYRHALARHPYAPPPTLCCSSVARDWIRYIPALRPPPSPPSSPPRSPPDDGDVSEDGGVSQRRGAERI